MNLKSCINCGVVVDLNRIEFVDPYPDYGKDDNDDYGEMDSHIIWGGDSYLDTWKCPVCETYNGVEKCEN